MNKKTSSIARKLNWSWTLKKLSTYFWTDVCIIAMVVGGWFYVTEKSYFGVFQLEASRSFYVQDISLKEVDNHKEYQQRLNQLKFQEIIENLSYEVVYELQTGSKMVRRDMGIFAEVFCSGAIFLCVIQLFDLFFTLCFGVISINGKLKPLDDMAKRAEELSKLVMDDSKYANLESAIEHVNPDAQDGLVQTGNKDLEGVEMAINNLLTRMRESYRQQSRFVSDASHELRTPIAVIQGYANMLDRWGKEDEQVLEESIEAIKHESAHMKTLIEQLLFLARGDAGRNTMNMQDISLKGIIREVYEESKMIDEKHEYFLVEESEDVIVNGDEAMLKQAIRILVDNAAKYTTEGENITLKSGINSERNPFFVIQDAGIGMNENDVAHIFERFYRSDEARNRQTGGTGLGLSIAKWIIDRHNGYVDVLSRTDIGTRFTVTFRRKNN